MSVFIENARVSDPDSPHHGATVSLFFKDGHLLEIGGDRPGAADRVIDEEGLWISPGWVDVGAQSGEPGFEQRETLKTLSRAARTGGYTHILIFPNTDPVLDSKTDIEYILRKAGQMDMSILPIGAATISCRGERITEMIDLHKSGAVAFSDGKHPIQNAATLLKALEYVKSFEGLIIQRPQISSLTFDGIMHEGEYSLRLGLHGIPPLSETSAVKQSIELLEYSGSKLLLHALSCRESMAVIKDHANNNDSLYCSVPAANLYFTDSELINYDASFKTLPPLRSEEDRQALIQGIEKGWIDMIVSNHEPVEKELKELEFQHAPFGMIGLSTSFAAARSATEEQLSTDTLIPLFSHRPRTLFGLSPATIEEGAPADHTLFQPDFEWTVKKEQLGSKSGNSPFEGLRLKGKAYATLWNNQLFYAL